MKKVLWKALERTSDEAYAFWCPGCKYAHMVYLKPSKSNSKQFHDWILTGSLEKPTFLPSVRVPAQPHPVRCHLWVKEGKLVFLGDCKHDLKNITVDMVELDPKEKYLKPLKKGG